MDKMSLIFANFPRFRPTWKFNNELNQNEFPTSSFKNFIIVDGLKSLNVLQPSILKKISPVASLIDHKVEVFKIDNDTILCAVEEINLNYFATITELLEPLIMNAENCKILSLQSASEFKSHEVPETCLIRSIGKSVFDDIKQLEVPNFITGVGAGIGTYRKIQNLPFSCFVVYIDIFDIVAIETILKFLKRLGINYDESVKLRPLHLKSDLYM
jgi:hypothetical protein